MGDEKRDACCAALQTGDPAGARWAETRWLGGFHAMAGMTRRLKPRSRRPASLSPPFTRFSLLLFASAFRFCFSLLLFASGFRFCFLLSLFAFAFRFGFSRPRPGICRVLGLPACRDRVAPRMAPPSPHGRVYGVSRQAGSPRTMQETQTSRSTSKANRCTTDKEPGPKRPPGRPPSPSPAFRCGSQARAAANCALIRIFGAASPACRRKK